MIAAVHRWQADALEIEAQAKRRLADEYDAAQERGEVAAHGGGRNFKVPDGNVETTVTDIGLTRKQVHEARQLRDAETAEPGIVRRVLDERLDRGEEPTKAAVRGRRGRDLILVKEKLGHGRFLPWIEAEFGMSEASAQRFMRCAETFKSVIVTDLPSSVLYALAAPSTPEPVRDNIVQMDAFCRC